MNKMKKIVEKLIEFLSLLFITFIFIDVASAETTLWSKPSYIGTKTVCNSDSIKHSSHPNTPAISLLFDKSLIETKGKANKTSVSTSCKIILETNKVNVEIYDLVVGIRFAVAKSLVSSSRLIIKINGQVHKLEFMPNRLLSDAEQSNNFIEFKYPNYQYSKNKTIIELQTTANLPFDPIGQEFVNVSIDSIDVVLQKQAE